MSWSPVQKEPRWGLSLGDGGVDCQAGELDMKLE